MDSTLLSVFALCASNNGAFKSEKQAKFFAGKFGNEIVAVESYAYGEHNGSRCNVTYTVRFDSAGIVSVTKCGAKLETTFTRGGVNRYAENKAKKAANAKLLRNEMLTIEIPYCEKTIAAKLADIQTVREAAGVLSDSIYQNLIAKLETEIAELHSRLNRLRAEVEAV